MPSSSSAGRKVRIPLARELGLRARLREQGPVGLVAAFLQEGAGDARGEELVHVGGPDGEEPEALQDREVLPGSSGRERGG